MRLVKSEASVELCGRKRVFLGFYYYALLDRSDTEKTTAICHRFLSPFYFTQYVTGYDFL